MTSAGSSPVGSWRMLVTNPIRYPEALAVVDAVRVHHVALHFLDNGCPICQSISAFDSAAGVGVEDVAKAIYRACPDAPTWGHDTEAQARAALKALSVEVTRKALESDHDS